MGGRIGNQAPTYEVVGEYAYSEWEELVDVFGHYGFTFDGAQQHELELFTAKDDNDKFAAKTVAISKPRQNGKSHGARFYAIWCAVVCGMQVVYSAHKADTVREFFELLCNIFENDEMYPDFASMLKKSYRQAGSESMTFTSGGRIRFSTRTNSGARGGTCSVLIIDEAQELTDAQLEAILPTISASATNDQQIIYIGTPPNSSCPGTVFRNMHKRAHSADKGNVWWMEWAVDTLPEAGVSKDDLLELAYLTNPALGVRITEAAVLNEADTMTLDGFSRERLGWWESDEIIIEPVLAVSDWQECLVPDSYEPEGKIAYGVKFSRDGDYVALSVAVGARSKPAHIELIEVAGTRSGIDWLAHWLIERKDKCAVVVIDGRSGAAALIQRLYDLGFPKKAIIECSSQVAQASTAMLVDEVRSHTITHIASPALDDSAIKSTKRSIGSLGGFVFDDGPASISAPIQSAAQALWGVRTTKRCPGRKAQIWL